MNGHGWNHVAGDAGRWLDRTLTVELTDSSLSVGHEHLQPALARLRERGPGERKRARRRPAMASPRNRCARPPGSSRRCTLHPLARVPAPWAAGSARQLHWLLAPSTQRGLHTKYRFGVQGRNCADCTQGNASTHRPITQAGVCPAQQHCRAQARAGTGTKSPRAPAKSAARGCPGGRCRCRRRRGAGALFRSRPALPARATGPFGSRLCPADRRYRPVVPARRRRSARTSASSSPRPSASV